IVMDYIATAEPIGSRTIAKKYDLGISSATIRNEMSDLEDLGLIMQPHTSSGRVPSDLGYRLYVDNLMRYRPLTDDETMFLQQMIMNNIHHVDYLMQETAKALAYLTRYAIIVSEPREKKIAIKYVQLMPMDERSILVIWVTDTKAVKNKILLIQDPPDYDTLTSLSKILNNALQNKTIEAIDKQMVSDLLEGFGNNARLLMPILGVLVNALKSDGQIYTSGVNNFLAFPEFADREKVQAVFKALEERDMLITLFGSNLEDDIQIIIGTENQVEPLQNCSVIRANFSLRDQGGIIGIIGPTRMDYAQAVSVMKGMLHNITKVLEALEV
ncbi:MAG: heat-inducible transcriptional repressor HrcA, partial [Defluviitaleaceae bacterium]|nr:heat-inducible transcriptional repressor HrcA [Defluviitaleaceae bacterium]